MYLHYDRFVISLIGIAVRQNSLFMANIEALSPVYGNFVRAFEDACLSLAFKNQELELLIFFISKRPSDFYV